MMDSVSHGETGFLYRFEDAELLAMQVCPAVRGHGFVQACFIPRQAGRPGAPMTVPRTRNN